MDFDEFLGRAVGAILVVALALLTIALAVGLCGLIFLSEAVR